MFTRSSARAVLPALNAARKCPRSAPFASSPRRTYARPAVDPVGVAKALQDSSPSPSQTLFDREFSLMDKVALVTGGNGGLGLETALAFVEAGARAVYCVDLAAAPGAQFTKVQEYASRIKDKRGEGRLEYFGIDVTDQEKIHRLGETIGDREGRLDVCFTGAGVSGAFGSGLTVSKETLHKVLDVNLYGSLYAAQAAGQQMVRFGNGGSIILVSSIAGHVTLRGIGSFSYEVSKGGVLQMARSLACELAPQGIRVNSISPGFVKTGMVLPVLDSAPVLVETLNARNPLGRMGGSHELRGVATWLASEASSYCTGTNIGVDGGDLAW
ncbi:sorbose reductase sou1 [Trametes elegans]|nr:sorbose reductase sou1 [Trametes elegans]